jgi:hypothetical protein
MEAGPNTSLETVQYSTSEENCLNQVPDVSTAHRQGDGKAGRNFISLRRNGRGGGNGLPLSLRPAPVRIEWGMEVILFPALDDLLAWHCE